MLNYVIVCYLLSQKLILHQVIVVFQAIQQQNGGISDSAVDLIKQHQVNLVYHSYFDQMEVIVFFKDLNINITKWLYKKMLCGLKRMIFLMNHVTLKCNLS